MADRVRAYLDELRRLGARAEEVREVESHLAETDAEPTATLGPARRLVRAFAAVHRPEGVARLAFFGSVFAFATFWVLVHWCELHQYPLGTNERWALNLSLLYLAPPLWVAGARSLSRAWRGALAAVPLGIALMYVGAAIITVPVRLSERDGFSVYDARWTVRALNEQIPDVRAGRLISQEGERRETRAEQVARLEERRRRLQAALDAPFAARVRLAYEALPGPSPIGVFLLAAWGMLMPAVGAFAADLCRRRRRRAHA